MRPPLRNGNDCWWMCCLLLVLAAAAHLIAVILVLGVIVLYVSLPWMIADAATDDNAATERFCETSIQALGIVAAVAVSLVCLLCSASLTALSNDAPPGSLVLIVCTVLLHIAVVVLCAFMLNSFFSGDCPAGSRGYHLSIIAPAIYLVPTACTCVVVCWTSLLAGRLISNSASADASLRTEASQEEPPRPVVYISTEQELLRRCLKWGDVELTKLLLDIDGRAKGNCFWRMWRAMKLGLQFCQCRRAAKEGKHRPRATLQYAYEDDLLNRPIHYVCLGPAQASNGGWGCNLRSRALPGAPDAWAATQLTDGARADVLRCLFLDTTADRCDATTANLIGSGTSGDSAGEFHSCISRDAELGRVARENSRRTSAFRLCGSDLVSVNADGWTPLHCCASSNSRKVLRALQEAMRQHQVAFWDVFQVKDVRGCSAIDVALQRGHLEIALQILESFPGRRMDLLQGCLSEFPRQSSQVESLLQAGLLRLGNASSAPDWVAKLLRRASVSHEEPHVAGHQSDELPAPTAGRSTSEVLKELARNVELIMSSTSVKDPQAAEAVLRHYRYQVNAAIASIVADRQAALKAAGATCGASTAAKSSPPAQRAVATEQRLCMICYDALDSRPHACDSLSCRHVCCDEDLLRHIEVQLEEGKMASCPFPECKIQIPEPILTSLLSTLGDRGQTLLERARKLRAHEFVDQCEDLRWCPSPGCNRSVRRRSESGTRGGGGTVCCECGAKFCFGCLLIGGHEPCSCSELSKWREAFDGALGPSEERLNEEWLKQNAQTCPGCQAPIQRTQGCNHMTCRVCSKEFCYVCGRPWEEHRRPEGGFDHYTCRASAQDATNVDRNFRRCREGFLLNRRNHAEVRSCAELLKALCGFMGIDLAEAMDEVANVVIVCRHTIQFCYVWRYCATSNASKYESWTAELEEVVAAIESTVNLEYMGNAAPEALAELQRGADVTDINIEKAFYGRSVSQTVARGLALEKKVAALKELCSAARVQRQRILQVAVLERLKAEGAAEGQAAAPTMTAAAGTNVSNVVAGARQLGARLLRSIFG